MFRTARRLARRVVQTFAPPYKRDRNGKFRPLVEWLESRDVPASVTVATIANAAEPSTNGTFRISRDGSTGSPLQVYAQVGGTATPTQDYSALGSQYTIGTGQSYVDVTVSVIDDIVYDPGETVTLTLQGGGGSYTVGSPSQATVTIADNETPPEVSVTKIDDATEGGGNGKFRFTRTGSTSGSLTANVVLGGTATMGSDYSTPSSGSFTVSFSPGFSTADYGITATNDSASEFVESVVFMVVSGTGYVPGTPSAAALYIYDNDANVVSVAQVQDAVEDGVDGSFSLTRTGDLSSAITVNYSVGGTATSGDDYTALTGSVTILANQSTAYVTVEAAPDALEEGDETVVTTVTSGTGYTVGSPSSATVTIVDTFEPPLAIGDVYITSVDTPVNVSVLDYTADFNGVGLSVSAVTQGANGSVVLNQDDTVTYTPNTGFAGEDSFTYTIEDPGEHTETATITVLVIAPDAPPTAIWTAPVTAVTLDPTELGFDLDGDTITATAVTQGSDGTVVLNQDGTVTYTPDTNFTGNDSFTYTIEDLDGNEATGTITVTVAASLPSALNDSVTTTLNTAVNVTVLDSAFNPAGGALTVSSVTQGSDGSVVLNQNGTVTYTPDTDFSGEDSFTYTVTDGSSNTSIGTITVTVGDQPDSLADEIEDALSDIVDQIADYPDTSAETIANSFSALGSDISQYIADVDAFLVEAGQRQTELLYLPDAFRRDLDTYRAALKFSESIERDREMLFTLLVANKNLIQGINQQLKTAPPAVARTLIVARNQLLAVTRAGDDRFRSLTAGSIKLHKDLQRFYWGIYFWTKDLPILDQPGSPDPPAVLDPRDFIPQAID